MAHMVRFMLRAILAIDEIIKCPKRGVMTTGGLIPIVKYHLSLPTVYLKQLYNLWFI